MLLCGAWVMLAALVALPLETCSTPSSGFTFLSDPKEIEDVTAARLFVGPSNQIDAVSSTARSQVRHSQSGGGAFKVSLAVSILAVVFFLMRCVGFLQIGTSSQSRGMRRSLAAGGSDACDAGNGRTAGPSDENAAPPKPSPLVSAHEQLRRMRLSGHDRASLTPEEVEELDNAAATFDRVVYAITELPREVEAAGLVYQLQQLEYFRRLFALAPQLRIPADVRALRVALDKRKEAINEAKAKLEQNLRLLSLVAPSPNQDALALLLMARARLANRTMSPRAAAACAAAKTVISRQPALQFPNWSEQVKICEILDAVVANFSRLLAVLREIEHEYTEPEYREKQLTAAAQAVDEAEKLISTLSLIKMRAQAYRLQEGIDEVNAAIRRIELKYPPTPKAVQVPSAPVQVHAAEQGEQEAISGKPEVSESPEAIGPEVSENPEALVHAKAHELGTFCENLLAAIEEAKNSEGDPQTHSHLLQQGISLVTEAEAFSIPPSVTPETVEVFKEAVQGSLGFLNALELLILRTSTEQAAAVARADAALRDALQDMHRSATPSDNVLDIMLMDGRAINVAKRQLRFLDHFQSFNAIGRGVLRETVASAMEEQLRAATQIADRWRRRLQEVLLAEPQMQGVRSPVLEAAISKAEVVLARLQGMVGSTHSLYLLEYQLRMARPDEWPVWVRRIKSDSDDVAGH